jgi:hypothetical protein
MATAVHSGVLEVAAIALACAFVVGAPAVAAAAAPTGAGPRVTLDHPSAAPGGVVAVRLDGWSPGTVTVGVCGNDARRGSEDCALIGDEAIAVRRTGTAVVDLTIVAPSVPCPCVVRATESGTGASRTAPITLIGVPTGPALDPVVAIGADQVDVHGVIESRDSWTQTLFRSLAGPSTKTLVVTVHNRGRTPVRGLRIVAQVGRSATGGSPLAARSLATIAPGADVVLRIPVHLSAPAFGVYQVAGAVYGPATPARFEVDTSNDPWGLELLAPVLLFAIARRVRRRERARELAETGDPGSPPNPVPQVHERLRVVPEPAWEQMSA